MYRSEIDGLRGISIIAVVFYYIFPNHFPGGFIGVDIFFVISGFLITDIILEEKKNYKFSILTFLERRARRIFPVLFFVSFALIPISLLSVSPSELITFGKTLISIFLLIPNLFFIFGGGYFNSDQQNHFLNIWSLGIEMQFYLLVPILFLLFSKKIIQNLFFIIIILSLILAHFGSSNFPTLTFLILPTRVWELLMGGIVAFYINKTLFFTKPLIAEIITLKAFFLIIISFFIFKSHTPWPSFYTLLPVISTCIIIYYSNFKTLVSKILSNKLLIFIGLISYSVYLWFYPSYLFIIQYFDLKNFTQKAFFITFILIISSLTWKYIELPFRKKNLFYKKNNLIIFFLIIFFFISYGYWSVASFSSLNLERKMALDLNKANYIYDQKNIVEEDFINYRIKFDNSNPDVIILGSSRAMQIGEHNYPKKILNFAQSGCELNCIINTGINSTLKYKPKTLLIGADPWLFNANLSVENQTLKSKLISFFQDLFTVNKNYSFINKEILLKFYFLINKSKFIPLNEKNELKDKIRKDGSRIYNINYINKSFEEFNKNSNNIINYKMKGYKHSEISEKHFKNFINKLSKDSNIILVLSPYHPYMYNQMRNEKPIFNEIEQIYKRYSETLGVRVIGSYDPSKINCKASEFFDLAHPNDMCMKKILKQLE